MLVLYKTMPVNHQYVSLIILPQSMRISIFSHLLAWPSRDHVGRYKTLYIMRIWFFWTKLREDIKKWVKVCVKCVSYNVWRTRKQWLHFSWLVTILFYIIHLNIWSPGTELHNNQEGCHIFNTMCGLKQFIITSITTDTKVESLAKLFMKEECYHFS